MKNFTVGVKGQEVEFKLRGCCDKTWFCAYVRLKGSSVLSDEWLGGSVTFRDGDLIGVDTGHAHNIGQTEMEMFISALDQISSVIDAWKEACE